MSELITLKEFCEAHNIDHKYARRLANKGQFPGAVKVLGKFWGIEADAEVPELPEKGSRPSARDDGRSRYIVYATADEVAQIEAMGCEVKDPREARKARKAAEAEASE